MRFNHCKVLILTFFMTVGQTVYAEKISASVWGHDVSWLHVLNAERLVVSVDDQIKDGCWRDIRSAVNAVKLQLIRSGYEVIDSDSDEASIFMPMVVLHGLGYRMGTRGACVKTIDLMITKIDHSKFADEVATLNGFYSKRVATYQMLISSSQAESSSQITDSFEELTREFLVDVQESKASIRNALKDQEKTEATDYWIDYLR